MTEARQRLALAGIESAGLEARLLVGHLLCMDSASVIAHGDRALSVEQAAAIRNLVAQRAAGRPIAYLLGQREFWSLPLRVDERCLIPRPETELLVERALERLPAQRARAIDLGTGSGAIILALVTERPQLEAWGSDASADALAVAADNARRLDLSVHWFRGRWLEAVAPRPLFDIIVSNPPYVDPSDPHLQHGDLRFEPRTALVAGDGGLADLATIAGQARARLYPGGWLLLEHGYDQGCAVRTLLTQHGYLKVASHRDPAGHERVTEGNCPG
ncbi:peptide chain release factor N(5)-glutamine methyltransferase [Thioalkalivibrio sp.]|uniref:peptide chain release factor N(5)-glutamine methyltransferase n=1 Tax=Thioalkalivibrio sp. TaxID=2093813 RepID=UPI0025D8B68A|nr:peptide chain release factor N(5)-glutamine methyltransferase [Thioalkalivibrio sp.]